MDESSEESGSQLVTRQLVSSNHPRRRQRRPRTPSRTCSSYISHFLSCNAKNQPPSDLCRPCSFQDLLGIFSVFPQVPALFAACEAGQSGHGDRWTVVPASIGTAEDGESGQLFSPVQQGAKYRGGGWSQCRHFQYARLGDETAAGGRGA